MIYLKIMMKKNKIISEILETSEDLICQQTLKISDELSRIIHIL